MAQVIDYYLSLQSPWTYLGHDRFVATAAKYDATVNCKPVDFGAIFPISGGLPLGKRAPQRQAYRMFELGRWKRHLDVDLNLEPKFFPVAELPAALLVTAAVLRGEDALALAGAILRGVWVGERNIAEEETLAEIAGTCGLVSATLLQEATSDAVKERYEAHTREAIERGVFGAPSYVLRDELFWGQDRLEFLDAALAGGNG